MALANLIRLVREGPARDALWLWEESGDSTIEGLAETIAEAVGSSRVDPVVKLETRRQGKEEGLRAFGVSLKQLACDAFPGVDMAVDWLLTKINGLFIRGLYDPSLVEELSRE